MQLSASAAKTRVSELLPFLLTPTDADKNHIITHICIYIIHRLSIIRWKSRSCMDWNQTNGYTYPCAVLDAKRYLLQVNSEPFQSHDRRKISMPSNKHVKQKHAHERVCAKEDLEMLAVMFCSDSFR